MKKKAQQLTDNFSTGYISEGIFWIHWFKQNNY